MAVLTIWWFSPSGGSHHLVVLTIWWFSPSGGSHHLVVIIVIALPIFGVVPILRVLTDNRRFIHA
jgi:hypothetical protein